MKGTRTFSQTDVIRLALKSKLGEEGDIDQSEMRSYQKRFKELIDFLHTHPCLEWPRGRNAGDHFLVVTMNLRQASPKRGGAYEYGPEDVVFLAALLRGYTYTELSTDGPHKFLTCFYPSMALLVSA